MNDAAAGPNTLSDSDVLAQWSRRLRLTPDEVAVLCRQGSVVAERRGRSRVVFKLRFRHGGRLKARSLGVDPRFAADVRAFLEHRKTARRLRREAALAADEVRRLLGTVKSELGPSLAAAGFYFHGLAIRRRRVRFTAPADDTAQSLTATNQE